MKIYRFLIIGIITVFMFGCMADTPASFVSRYEDCVNRKDLDCIVSLGTDHLIQANGGLTIYKAAWPYTFDRHTKMTYQVTNSETIDTTAEVKITQTHYFAMADWDPYTEYFIWTLKKDPSGNWRLDAVVKAPK